MNFVVKTGKSASPALRGKYLKGPRSPAQVKRDGYSFTAVVAEAWPFTSHAKALQKARIVARHIGWSDNLLVKPLSGELSSESCQICGCTEADCSGCIARVGAPCHWVAAGVCSSCAERPPEGCAYVEVRYASATWSAVARRGPKLPIQARATCTSLPERAAKVAAARLLGVEEAELVCVTLQQTEWQNPGSYLIRTRRARDAA